MPVRNEKDGRHYGKNFKLSSALSEAEFPSTQSHGITKNGALFGSWYVRTFWFFSSYIVRTFHHIRHHHAVSGGKLGFFAEIQMCWNVSSGDVLNSI